MKPTLPLPPHYLCLFVLIYLAAFKADAQFSGNQVVTPEDYPVFGPLAANNPPFCGMPYNSLDLNRITAVPGIGFDGCYTCLQVSNAADPSKCLYVMVVDRGGVGLDLSTGAFDVLFGQHDSPAPVQWNTVSKSFCEGIWKDPTSQSGYTSSSSSSSSQPPSGIGISSSSTNSPSQTTTATTTATAYMQPGSTKTSSTTSSSTTATTQNKSPDKSSTSSIPNSNDNNPSIENNNSASGQVQMSSQSSSAPIIYVMPWTIILILEMINFIILS